MTEISAKKLVRIHQKITAARKALKSQFENEDSRLKEQQKVVEAAMLDFLNTTGQKTAKTDIGLFYWQEKIIPTGADWDALFRWVREENAFDIFERRIKTGFIKEYMEHNEDNLPPGVNLYREREICVRKSQ